ncbi:MAG: ABC transporter ATP-binding protein, partial [Thermoplasmata archaeon]|nr:ABC transporter ATP-binding protein [Thermoplasmata archaeon]MCK4454863.1 ABC transporter ATP-binding protein [Thermoplasmata archaeon]
QRKVKDYLLGHVRNGGTIFMCTHLLEMAEKLCSSVAIINGGSIIAWEGIDQLLSEFGSLENAFISLVGERGSR